MIRVIALALTVLTGFSGLVYEVAWQKYLATMLGSHSEATAAVLAIFLGGLAVGYAVFGRVTARVTDAAARAGRRPPLLRLYGIVEATIGVWALLFPWLFGAAAFVSVRMPLDHEVASFSFDLLLTILLIGPPTVMMGGTIPVLTQALSEHLEEATRVHAFVYAFNTLGAFGGALAGGFVLVPWLGLDGVVRAMGAVNLAAGAVFVLLRERRAVPAPGPGEARASALAPENVPAAALWGYGAVALLGGFSMMAVQTVLNRIGGLSFGASHFTFAMVVAVFVLCIALGSFAVSVLPSIPRWLVVGSQWLLVALLGLVYFGLGDAPYWAHVLRSLFRDVPAGFYPYHVTAFVWVLAVLAVPIGLSGALLPLLFHHLRSETGELGATAGRLYSLNTLGSLLGALLGGYALLFWLDLHEVYRVALGGLAAGAALLTALVLRARGAALVLLGVALLAVVRLPAWQPDRIAAGLFRVREPLNASYRGPDAFYEQAQGVFRVIFHVDDPAVSVTVTEARLGTGEPTRSVRTNGKADGNLHADYPTMALAALLPALFAEDPSDTFVIGYGTGVTAGELAALDEVDSVVVAEISKGVIDAAPLFDYGNLQASKQPEVEIVRSDAYRALLRSARRYGIISSEPSNPWVTGVEMLYSREFLEAARDRLVPGGIYAQWFHLYEVDAATVTLVLRTYREVFDEVSVWFTQGPDLLILGFQDGGRPLDVERLARRFARPDFRAGFARAGIDSMEELLAHEILPLGVVNAARMPGPIHTLRHPILSHSASRAFFVGGDARVPRFVGPESIEVGRRSSLLRRHAGLEGIRGPVGEDVLAAMAEETCLRGRPVECTAVLARWLHDHPGSPRLAEALAAARRAPGLDGAAEPASLEPVAALVDGRDRATDGSGNPVSAALAATAAFGRHYHHALPLDRAALRNAFAACERNPGTVAACLEAREVVERELGPLRRRAADRPPPG